MKSFISPSLVSCVISSYPFTKIAMDSTVHTVLLLSNVHCTQTRKTLCKVDVFTYEPRDPIRSSWYVPKCRQKNASLQRNAATVSRSKTTSTFWKCLFGVMLE